MLRAIARLPLADVETGLMEAVTLASNFDEMAVVHQSVKESGDRRLVSEHFCPVLERSIRRDDRRRTLLATHDDLEQIWNSV